MTGSGFKDHFSGHASSYAAHRPGYPDELFVALADVAPARELAWDCATGNGQAARSLAAHFQRVVATDASADQIASASPQPGVEFLVAPAEASALPSASVDLVTVAQALHWFNVERFFEEAARVLKPAGVLACWSYHRCGVGKTIDPLIEAVFDEVAEFWPPEREIVENRYRGIAMPFREIALGPFSMTARWTARQMLDYMRTWSASQRYLKANGQDPLRDFESAMHESWGDGLRTVSWPLILRAAVK